MASLINVDVMPTPGATLSGPAIAGDLTVVAASASSAANQKGVFITSQSLVTFPGAAAFVTIIWQVLGAVNGDWGTDKRIALLIALIVGMAIYYSSAKPGQSRQEQVTGALIAVFNSFFLAATALGIAAVPNSF